MPPVALAPCVTRTSAAMILITQGSQAFVFDDKEFQLPVPSWCQDIINVDIFLTIQHIKG